SYSDYHSGAVNPFSGRSHDTDVYSGAASGSGQAVQDFDSLREFAVIGRVTQAKMRVTGAKDASGNAQEPIPGGFFNKCRAGSSRTLGEKIKRTAGLDHLKPVLESLMDQVTLSPVAGHDIGHVIIECGNAGVLNHARSADEAELLQLNHLLDYPLR